MLLYCSSKYCHSMCTVVTAFSAVHYRAPAVRFVNVCVQLLLFLCCTVSYCGCKNCYIMCTFLTACIVARYCIATVRIVTICVQILLVIVLKCTVMQQ